MTNELLNLCRELRNHIVLHDDEGLIQHSEMIERADAVITSYQDVIATSYVDAECRDSQVIKPEVESLYNAYAEERLMRPSLMHAELFAAGYNAALSAQPVNAHAWHGSREQELFDAWWLTGEGSKAGEETGWYGVAKAAWIARAMPQPVAQPVEPRNFCDGICPPPPTPAPKEQDMDADRYRWLRDLSEPGICSFYLSVGQAFKGVKFSRETVDEAIDAAIESMKEPK